MQIAYYQLEGTAVIIDTRHSLPWCWRDGQWTKAPDLLDACAATGTELARADFFRRFPGAALQISTSNQYTTSSFTWGPVIDGTFLEKPLTEVTKKGDLDIDFGYGFYNSHEGTFPIPFSS